MMTRRQVYISTQCVVILLAAAPVTSFVQTATQNVFRSSRVATPSADPILHGATFRRNAWQPFIPFLRVSLSESDEGEVVRTNNKFQNATYEAETEETAATATNERKLSTTDESAGVDPTSRFVQEKLVQAGFLAAVALASYYVVTLVLSATMDVASSASHALGDEIVHELGALGRFAFGLLVAFFELIKVVVPIVGKGIMAAGKAAAPVVQETSSKIAEVATPYVQEAARSLNEAAAPYVDSVATAVDTSIVTPVRDAVDANIVAPMEDARNVVASSVDATLSGVSQTVTTTVQSVAADATNTVKEAVSIPMQGVSDSVKDATKSMRDILPF